MPSNTAFASIAARAAWHMCVGGLKESWEEERSRLFPCLFRAVDCATSVSRQEAGRGGHVRATCYRKRTCECITTAALPLLSCHKCQPGVWDLAPIPLQVYRRIRWQMRRARGWPWAQHQTQCRRTMTSALPRTQLPRSAAHLVWHFPSIQQPAARGWPPRQAPPHCAGVHSIHQEDGGQLRGGVVAAQVAGSQVPLRRSRKARGLFSTASAECGMEHKGSYH